jgi:hypothetical protein
MLRPASEGTHKHSGKPLFLLRPPEIQIERQAPDVYGILFASSAVLTKVIEIDH